MSENLYLKNCFYYYNNSIMKCKILKKKKNKFIIVIKKRVRLTSFRNDIITAKSENIIFYKDIDNFINSHIDNVIIHLLSPNDEETLNILRNYRGLFNDLRYIFANNKEIVNTLALINNVC